MGGTADTVSYRRPAVIVFGLTFGLLGLFFLSTSVYFRTVSKSMIDDLEFAAPLQVDSRSWDCRGYELGVSFVDGEGAPDLASHVKDQLVRVGFEPRGTGEFYRDRDDQFDADVVTVVESADGAVTIHAELWDTDSVPCLPF